MKLNEINQLGASKYFEDRGAYRNPYIIGSPEFNEFERGWMQSLKKDGAHLVSERDREVNRQQKNTYLRQTTANIDAERYRSRKG